ncbi:RCC1 domain-containing protein [Chondromyces apiculatus]|uniref:BNR repeat domain protein n=1 Tax=Chondromyces apiculatus DSM 436 TaxID=1192034 RepID=A0A017T236_9BACT|nr:EGF domain-containing protein [Chondromyces apiculatus]EYF03334.1 BNR repeat domain protein [Chondromyces apiculatus DSM 436]
MAALFPATTTLLACGGGGEEPTPPGGDGGTTTVSGTGGAGGEGGGGTGGSGGTSEPCGVCGENASCGAEGACVCNEGYSGDGQSCDDVDECFDQLDDCHPSAACTNTEGSFTCACPSGTVGDPYAGCEARYKGIASGSYHTCALRVDGAVVCFGAGGNGRLGNGLGANQATPVRAGAASNWAHLAAGASHTCGIKENGNVWCWGNNGNGQLGLGNTESQSLPAWVSLDRTWTGVAAGEQHSCAVESDGTLSCWGRNNAGQLGVGAAVTQAVSPTYVSVDPAALTPENDWLHVEANRESTCALKQDGRLYCWGQNSDLQIAKTGGGTVPTPSLVETAAGAMDMDWAAVSVGPTSCAVKMDGRLFCWGRGAEGQLANGVLAASAVPVQVAPGTTFAKVRAGITHVCAIDTADALSCWGRNQSAQVEAGQNTAVTSPRPRGAGSRWVDVAPGLTHTCALDDEGRVSCWGSRLYGQLGDAMTSLETTAAPIGTASWARVDTFGELGCGIQEGGDLYCWGNNETGQLGFGDTASRAAPTEVTTALSFSRIAMGRQHACGITSAGAIVCSGRNSSGQLGRGNTTPATTFEAILTQGKPYSGLTWGEIALGEDHGCSIATNGTLWCWGRNNQYQLGAEQNPAVGSLREVLPTGEWTAVAAGQFHTCATRADGALWCWGRNNEGQIGVGTAGNPTGKNGYVPTSLGTGWRPALAGGVSHTCAIKQTGTLWCWGRNANGQLGDNTTTDNPAPLQVGTDTDWVEVTAGNSNTCARKQSGAVYCWGFNGTGQLGLGDVTQRRVPFLLGGAADWGSIRLGFTHACGLSTDGALRCWGSGENGQNAQGDGFSADLVAIAEAK